VHLELETDVELVRQDPFDNLAGIDPAKDRGKQNRSAPFR
jgi:hypothetical protein